MTAPSPLASPRSSRGSVAPYNIDVLGFHPPAEPTDFELALIDDLLQKYGDSLRTFVLLKRDARLSKESKASKGVLWPRYTCSSLSAHGDGASKVPFGRAFDSLIRRCEDVKK